MLFFQKSPEFLFFRISAIIQNSLFCLQNPSYSQNPVFSKCLQTLSPSCLLLLFSSSPFMESPSQSECKQSRRQLSYHISESEQTHVVLCLLLPQCHYTGHPHLEISSALPLGAPHQGVNNMPRGVLHVALNPLHRGPTSSGVPGVRIGVLTVRERSKMGLFWDIEGFFE